MSDALDQPIDAQPEFLRLLKLKPGIQDRSVFRYLKYEEGPNKLADVTHKALIACTARSGSSLLQVCLERYGLKSQEYFNVEGPPKQLFQSGTVSTIREYADWLATNAVTPDDFFIAKGAYPAFLFLYFLGEGPNLRPKWKIIFLRRHNVIRQAISMKIAAMTQQWTADMPAHAEVRKEDYSFDDIAGYMDVILNENQIWERVFAHLSITPFRMFYENFVRDLDMQTEFAAKFIGVDVEKFPRAAMAPPRLKTQSTEINDEWERRFRFEISRRALPGFKQSTRRVSPTAAVLSRQNS